MEGRAVRKIEVVVEAVGDRGADRVLRTGEEVGDGFGHHVRGRVPQNFPARVGGGHDDLDGGVGVEWPVQVGPLAVDLGGHRRLPEAGPDGRRDGRRRRASVELPRGTIGQRDRDLAHDSLSRRLTNRDEGNPGEGTSALRACSGSRMQPILGVPLV